MNRFLFSLKDAKKEDQFKNKDVFNDFLNILISI